MIHNNTEIIHPKEVLATKSWHDRIVKEPPFRQTQTFSTPKFTAAQQQAVWNVFNVVGLCDFQQPEAFETRRRCMNLATMIFEENLPDCPFSANSLIDFVNFFDAFKKTGFFWLKELRTESELIIPKQPLFEIDQEEYMDSFRRLFTNYRKLSLAAPITLGLFLLFFHRLIVTQKNTDINWGTIVSSIIDRTKPYNYNIGV